MRGIPKDPTLDKDCGSKFNRVLPPLSVCIELTRRCNMRCLHCGSAAGRALANELTVPEFRQVFEDLSTLGCERVVLLGGEPLLHPGWPALVALAAQQGLEVALITNGWPVTSGIAKTCSNLPLHHVGVSIDGASDEVHDAIRGVAGARMRAWRAVNLLRDAGLPVTVITTLNRMNLSEIAKLADQLVQANRHLVWQLQVANGSGFRFDPRLMLAPPDLLEVARFVQHLRRNQPAERLMLACGHSIGHYADTVNDYSTKSFFRGCPGGRTAAGICSDGSVKACLSMEDTQAIGNLRKIPFTSLWHSDFRFAAYRRRNPENLKGGCRRCPHKAMCLGGCPQMARAATGHGYDNPFCLRQVEQTIQP